MNETSRTRSIVTFRPMAGLRNSFLVTALTAAVSLVTAGAQVNVATDAKTLAERLGYPREAKLLIVHADDLGMARSVNAASTKAFDAGLVNSGSIMVPCPWFAEMAAYARSHPQMDLGLHLTLTSEWNFYRWGPVTPEDQVGGLLDKQGYLYPTALEAATHATPREVETEIRAQIERARAFGIEPTHLDSHMGTLYSNRTLLETLLKVAREYKLPVMIAREWFARADFLPAILGPSDIVIDRVIQAGPEVQPERWEGFYTDAIKNLQPGVTEIIVHLAYDDEEMRGATVDHKDWGSAWRQRDFDFFTSDKCRRLFEENKVKLITYRELGKLLKAAN